MWTLATEDVSIPDVLREEGLTAARLAELRTVLATLAAAPIATLEAHPMSARRDRSGGIALHAASPLAQLLSQLVTQTAKTAKSSPPLDVADAGDVLYRMVVPAKFAAQVGKGLVKPMASKAHPGGNYGDLVGPAGIVAKATYVPVASKAATAGAASGSAAGVAAASGVALTVAAPLMLMAVAVSVSAHAEHQRQESIERITDLLERLHEDKLENERNELDGCRDAIHKAAAILLDQGRIGLSLGLDSAAHAIDTSIARTRGRLTRWQNALAALPEGPVELGALTTAFPGITEDGGTFRAHFELARLAIALKRRVLVLQAVEHAQLEGTNHPFQTFVRALQDDERRIDELEAGIESVLLRLSTLELKRRGGFRSIMYTPGEVDNLLKAAYRLRALGDGLNAGIPHADVAIEIERSNDGSLTVFPGVPA